MEEKFSKNILNSLTDDYLNIVNKVLFNEEFIKRKEYHHHEKRSVYGHSLIVSINSYKIAYRLGLDYKSVAIAGLLHDFYYKDWQLNKEKKSFFKLHGFVHAKEALENSKKVFPELMNKKIENAIKRHMFPLNLIPPLYLESWLICIVDKICSLEVFKTPTQLYKYIGIRKK